MFHINKKIHRFIGAFEINAERLLIRDAEMIHQIKTVLRLKPGEQIVLADGGGREAGAEIKAVAGSGIEVAIIERRPAFEPAKQVILYCALLKRENFEYVVEKAVECGAAKIVPLITARTVKLGYNLDRLKKIAREAAEQSGRGLVPEITAPIKLAAAMKTAGENDVNYFFDATGEDFSRAKSLAKTVGVWIGPEGGWEEFEIAAASQNGFLSAALGTLVLRAETAATVAVYLAAR